MDGQQLGQLHEELGSPRSSQSTSTLPEVLRMESVVSKVEPQVRNRYTPVTETLMV